MRPPVTRQFGWAPTILIVAAQPPGHDRDDQCLRGGPDAAGVALQALWRPVGLTPVRAGHVLGLSAVTRAAIAPGMGCDALAAVEHLDRALRRPRIDLFADQCVRHRVEEALHLDPRKRASHDMVVDADARQMPLGILRSPPAAVTASPDARSLRTVGGGSSPDGAPRGCSSASPL
jgi:hypothetical protein